MPVQPFGQSDEFLIDAAVKFFSDYYENPTIKINEEIDERLNWRPSIHFKAKKFLTIIAEVSPEKLYPEIFNMQLANILDIHMPISIFSVCPEELYLNSNNQKEAKSLRAHGYGLLTIDNTKKATKRFGCIPIIQHISEDEFKKEIELLPKKIKVELKDAFERYQDKSDSGMQKITELVEAIVLDAGKKSAKKNWISNTTVKGGASNILDEMLKETQFQHETAPIGGMRSYLKDYRNPSHHAPRSKKQAYEKFQDCQHGFREGIKVIKRFRFAMKQIGIQINI